MKHVDRWHCHIKWCWTQKFEPVISSRSCGRAFPYTECFGAKALEPGSIFEMTLNGEGIVDGGVDVEEPLGGSG